MKTIIKYKGLKVEITIDDDMCNETPKREGVTPPDYPDDIKFPMSLKDKREMDKQLEAAKQILEEEH